MPENQPKLARRSIPMKKLDLLQTLEKLQDFLKNPQTSEISCESKNDLTLAAKAVEALHEKAKMLDEDSQEGNFDALKVEADKIVAGALLYVIVEDDLKYAYQSGGFFHRCKYPLMLNKVLNNLPQSLPASEIFSALGHRVLILKELPFTGNMQHDFNGVFADFESHLEASYFSQYQLNQDLSTTCIKAKQERELIRKEDAKRENKLKRNLGFFDTSCDVIYQLNKEKTPTEKYFIHKEQKENLRDKESVAFRRLDLQYKALTILSYLVSPFTLFISLRYTNPWLLAKKEALKTQIENRTWVELTLPIDEYQQIQKAKSELKKTFKPLEGLEQRYDKELKPHKACVGLTADGKKASKLDDVKNVSIICDKAQAKRWTLSFYQKATEESYQQTINESIKLGMP